MLVSSVDVEEGLNNNGKWNKQKQKQKQNAQDGVYYEEEGGTDMWMDPESLYADADSNHEPKMQAPPDAPSYEAAERAWSTYLKITAPEELNEEGRIVGWWALGINPITYTPENLLTLARLVSSSTEVCTVTLVRRPGENKSGMLSFEDEVCEEYTWADVLAGGWKLVA